MTAPISFNAYTGWVNVTDPANVPADVRIISAEDLLRYENFNTAAKTAINELIATTEAQGGDLTTLKNTAAAQAAASASKAYDVTLAGGAKTLATVTAGAPATSFAVTVVLVGRSSAGDIYLKATRYVRPENGSPVTATPVPDVVLGNIAVSFTTTGATTTIKATATGADALLTAYVEVKAGAGDTAGAARTAALAMA